MVDDNEALELIMEFFKEKKAIGYEKVDILDVMCGTELPPEQINRVIKTIENRYGVIINTSSEDSDYDDSLSG